MGRQAEAQTLRHVMGELLGKSVFHIFLAEHVDPQVLAAACEFDETRRRGEGLSLIHI